MTSQFRPLYFNLNYTYTKYIYIYYIYIYNLPWRKQIIKKVTKIEPLNTPSALKSQVPMVPMSVLLALLSIASTLHLVQAGADSPRIGENMASKNHPEIKKIRKTAHERSQFPLPPVIMEVENGSWKMCLVPKWTIFHFYDYGRKCI